MILKIVIAIVIALVTLVLFRQFSERDKRARVRIRQDKTKPPKA